MLGKRDGSDSSSSTTTCPPSKCTDDDAFDLLGLNADGGGDIHREYDNVMSGFDPKSPMVSELARRNMLDPNVMNWDNPMTESDTHRTFYHLSAAILEVRHGSTWVSLAHFIRHVSNIISYQHK